MPLVNFRPNPGINKEVTDYTGEGKWTDGDNVRFFQGLPQKIKGWQKFISTTLVGVVRDQHAWISLDGTRHDAVGTDRKLYIIQEGLAYDITPIRETQALTNPFTTNATTSVVVTDTAHGAQKGDFVTFDSFSAINGLDMNKEFEVTSVANNNAYVVTATSAASGSTSGGGGTGNAKYQINIGPEFSVPAFGWGTDTWSSGTWGTPSSSSNVTLEARQWSLDNFGEDLIAVVLNGGAFKWDTSGGVATRAAAITNAPTKSRLGLVSTPDRHLLLMGSQPTIGGTNAQDDLLIRFSNQEDIETYQPTAENTAGTLRIADGSRIVAAERSRGQILVWTDTSLHSMQFIGPPFTFGLRQLGQNCGIIGQHAGIDINGVSYWMSQDSFFLFDGTVKKLPCTVEQYIFDNINQTGSENAFAGHNGEYNEILWFYNRTGSDQINAVVAYNYLEQTWWIGTLDRTAWIDREVYDNPVASDYLPTTTANNEVISGLTDGATQMFLHEVGNNGDDEAITAYVKSGSVEIGQGDEFSFVSKLIPDVQNQEGTLNMNLEFKNYPNNSTSVIKTTSFVDSTEFVSLRGRGREFTVNVISNTTGTAWRLGTQRLKYSPMVEDNFLKSIRNKKVNLTEQQVLERFYDRFRWPKFYPWGQPSVEAINEEGENYQDFFLEDNYIDSNKCIKTYLDGYTLILSNIGGFCKDTWEIQTMINNYFKINVNCNFYFGNGKKSVSFDKHNHDYSVLVKNIYGKSKWIINKEQVNLENQDCIWFNKDIDHQVTRIDNHKLSMTCNII